MLKQILHIGIALLFSSMFGFGLVALYAHALHNQNIICQEGC